MDQGLNITYRSSTIVRFKVGSEFCAHTRANSFRSNYRAPHGTKQKSCVCFQTMKHISHSAFMAPGDAALSAAGGVTVHPPAAVATAKVASTDTKVADPTEQARLLAKMEKQKTHLERTISDMSAARDRNKVRFNESNFRGGRGDSDRGDRDRSRDSRRSDDRR